MKGILCLLSIYILGFISCQSKTQTIDYRMTDDQLSNLMLDMQLSDVALGEVNGPERDSLKEVLRLRIEQLYKQPIIVLEGEVRKLESDPEKLNLVMNKVQLLLDSLR